jgi:CHASE2 domain-containing sensor protein
LGFVTLDKVETPNSRDARRVKRKPEVAFAGAIGRQATIFDTDDVVRLLRAAVEREGGQTAFAARYGLERTMINAILADRRPVTESVAKALGLRRTYTTK